MTVNQKTTALAVATIGDEDDPPADTIPFSKAVQRLHAKCGATETEVAMWMFLYPEVLRGWAVRRGSDREIIGGRIYSGERKPSESVSIAVRWIMANDVHLSATQVDALVVDDDDRWIDFETAKELISKKAKNAKTEEEIIQAWRGVHEKLTDIENPTFDMPEKVAVTIPFGYYAKKIEGGLVMRKQFESFLKRQAESFLGQPALASNPDAMATLADEVVDRSGRSLVPPTKTTIDLLREAGKDPVVGLHYRAQLTSGKNFWMDDASRLAYDRDLTERFKLGRYKLWEAVQFILEGEKMAIDPSSMLVKLEQGIKNGALTCHLADHIDQWVYADGERFRPWHLECYWSDLNLWLDEREKRITCRFPDPAKQPKPYVSPRGITKQQVITAFSNMHFDDKQWSKYLATPAPWLEECRVQRGSKSTKHPSLWNPVLLGVSLSDDERRVPLSKLDNAFRGHSFLKDWQEEWKRATEDLRR